LSSLHIIPCFNLQYFLANIVESLKMPSKNYTCFILRRFRLFLIQLQSKNKAMGAAVQYMKCISIILKVCLVLMKLLSLSQFYAP